MNTYTLKFFGNCPSNGVRVEYDWALETPKNVQVEYLLLATTNIDHRFHEQIADQFLAKFGGLQTITAFHHGVHIKTIRGSL